MILFDELSALSPKEKVCIRVKSGITCTSTVKNALILMDYYKNYEVMGKTESYKFTILNKGFIKTTTIYI